MLVLATKFQAIFVRTEHNTGKDKNEGSQLKSRKGNGIIRIQPEK